MEKTDPRIPELADVDRIRKPEQLERMLSRFDFSLDKLRGKKNAVERRQLLTQALERGGLNGRSREMAEKLLRKSQEFDRKESFLSKVKEKLTAPLRRTFEVIKRHPYITAAVIIAVLGAASLYYTGAGPAILAKIKTWVASKFGAGAMGKAVEAVGGAAEAAKDAAGAAVEGAKDAAGGVIDKMPMPQPKPVPPSPPFPTEVTETLDQLMKGR